MGPRHQVHIGLVTHRAQMDAVREPDGRGLVRHRSHEQGLRLLRLETGRQQPCPQVGRPVVRVQLPLELVVPELGPVGHLRGDRRVRPGGVQVRRRPDDPVPVVGRAHLPYESAGALDADAGAVGAGVLAHLAVENGQ